jgi:hypothetical protein
LVVALVVQKVASMEKMSVASKAAEKDYKKVHLMEEVMAGEMDE